MKIPENFVIRNKSAAVEQFVERVIDMNIEPFSEALMDQVNINCFKSALFASVFKFAYILKVW